MRVGAAKIDVTPSTPLAMAGFAARTDMATGAHDPLTVRAIAVDETVIVCADVVGLHEASCDRIRRRAAPDGAHIVVAALHTHGGPACMPGRIGGSVDDAYLARLEDACVAAIEAARATRKPARLLFGLADDPGVARNRRHARGPVDSHLPVMRFLGDDGAWIAVIAAYACHPVVLGADNLLWTADYPHVVREALEAAHPGALALFLTGCAGDANTGHSAQASINLGANPDRTFAMAATVGARIARCAIAAPQTPATGQTQAAAGEIALRLARRETDSLRALSDRWRAERAICAPARAALLSTWIAWADGVGRDAPTPWRARATVLSWGGQRIVALPGEIFAATALSIRARLGDADAMVIGFCDGCPGYIPPAPEFEHGGYEIDEAHRYYGMPATFAPGSAEALTDLVVALADGLSRSFPC